MADTAKLTIEIPKAELERLQSLAGKADATCAELAAELFSYYLSEYEWKMNMILESTEDIKAGRVVPHEKVAAWMESWGTDHELPPPQPE